MKVILKLLLFIILNTIWMCLFPIVVLSYIGNVGDIEVIKWYLGIKPKINI